MQRKMRIGVIFTPRGGVPARGIARPGARRVFLRVTPTRTLKINKERKHGNHPEQKSEHFAGKNCRQRPDLGQPRTGRSEEHTSELQSLMRISYAVFCLKKKK